jgi:hypothetical protein
VEACRLFYLYSKGYESVGKEFAHFAKEEDYELSVTEQEILALQLTIIEDWRLRITDDDKCTVYRVIACDQIEYTVYRGRVGIHKLLEATDTMKQKTVE